MSRTDVHRPAWVQDRDVTLRRHFAEHHDHRNSRCDLPDWWTATGWIHTTCSLSYRWGPNIYCGCDMCTGGDAGRLARKQERVRWRTIRQRILATAPQDRDDIDVPPLHGSAW